LLRKRANRLSCPLVEVRFRAPRKPLSRYP
jgi:hypothetical protein